MPRGGKRKGAGRKSTWQNSKTCLIRVPEVLSEQLMLIAHKLDSGETLELETKSNQIPLDLSLFPDDVPGPLGQRALADRCGISNGTIGSNKAKYDWRRFAKWIYGYDPDDLHWVFDPSIKKYRVIDYIAACEASKFGGSALDAVMS